MLKKTIILCLFSITCITHSFSVEPSLISTIESLENETSLVESKYSAGQLQQIHAALEKKEEKIRVASFNILFDFYDHNLEESYRWPQRFSRIVHMIEEIDADLIGVQELYGQQIDDLTSALQERYTFFGKPCSDGEVNGIFYDTERFSLIETHIWFLSEEEPTTPSSSTLTLLLLKDEISGQQIAMSNTHLAFSNINKREIQAKRIHEYLSEFSNAHPNCPLVLTGDFNTFPNYTDLENLPFYDGDYIENLLKGDLLVDARTHALLGHLGPLSSFTNEGENPAPFQGTGTLGVFLDHIFVSRGTPILIHAIHPGTVDGLFPSDHMPLTADLILSR